MVLELVATQKSNSIRLENLPAMLGQGTEEETAWSSVVGRIISA